MLIRVLVLKDVFGTNNLVLVRVGPVLVYITDKNTIKLIIPIRRETGHSRG